MILVDTSVWISALHGFDTVEVPRLRIAIQSGTVIVGDLILMEMLRGARTEVAAERFRRQMTEFPIVDLGGRRIAEQAAANYRKLRTRGITIRSSIDLLIATFCLEGGHSLLHRDRDFTQFEQLLGLHAY